MKSLKEKFLKKVCIPPEGCWLWMGAKNKKGYGHMGVDGKIVSAHKLAYLLFVGEVPEGMHVCHMCDNPSCVRWTDHLFLGSPKDNTQDMIQKGREKFRKLSKAQAEEIKILCKNGGRPEEIAPFFNVSARQIRRVLAGQRSGNTNRNRSWTQLDPKLKVENLSVTA